MVSGMSSRLLALLTFGLAGLVQANVARIPISQSLHWNWPQFGYRSKSFLRVSRFFEDHPNFEEELRGLPREAAAKRFREIYGVGPATTSYLLFESLKHLDAFDHVSPWEQKILSRLMFRRELVPAERILKEARKRWGRWRMLAVHYIFEDLFWRHEQTPVEWLDELIRL